MPSDWMDRRKLMQRLNDRSTPLSWKEDVGYTSWMIIACLVGVFLTLVWIKSAD